MSDATYVPCPHCGHPYPMSPMQKELYRGRTLSCNNCAKPFSADNLTPQQVPAPRPAPAVERAAAPASTATVAPAAQNSPRRPAKRMSGWAVAASSVGGAAVLILLLVLVLLPPLNRAREQANRVKCASNLRQLGQAMFIYASVNGGQFPDRIDRLLSFAGSNVFVCPSCDDTPAPGQTPQIQASNLYARGHLSYVYVGAGLTTSSRGANAPTTPVLYEPLTNHGDGINVLYADGSVAFLPKGAAQTLIASFAATSQPATQPATQPTTQPGAAPQ